MYRYRRCDFLEDDAGDAVIAITKSGTNEVPTKITLDNFDYQNLEKISDGHGGTTIYDPPAISCGPFRLDRRHRQRHIRIPPG